MDVLPFLSKYALNIRASCFPVLTARRRRHATTDLEILMLGDSHGWGQGAPGYDVIFPAYSSHMAVPYSKGYFAKLREHLLNKYDFYPSAVIPESDDRAEDGSPIIRGSYQIVQERIVEPVAAEVSTHRTERIARRRKTWAIWPQTIDLPTACIRSFRRKTEGARLGAAWI